MNINERDVAKKLAEKYGYEYTLGILKPDIVNPNKEYDRFIVFKQQKKLFYDLGKFLNYFIKNKHITKDEAMLIRLQT